MNYKQIISLACLTFACSNAMAQKSYVSDRLFLGLYADATITGSPIKSMASGTEVQVLQNSGTAVLLQLNDGTQGWARADFISEKVPASLQLGQVTTERDKLQQTLNTLQQDSGKSATELKKVQGQLRQANNTINKLRKQAKDTSNASAEDNQALANAEEQLANNEKVIETLKAQLITVEEQSTALQQQLDTVEQTSQSSDALVKIVWILAAMLCSLAIGVFLGMRRVTKQVKERFNGIKVW